MNITEIRINLVGGPTDRVKAFSTVTLDGVFVIRDLKVIEGPSGLFLAMPSRKLADRCPRCATKNHLRARYCNQCGGKLNENRAPRDPQGRAKLHADVAHPINADCRELIQTSVINAYNLEVDKSGQPGYAPSPLIDEELNGGEFDDVIEAAGDRLGLACPPPPLPRVTAPRGNASIRTQPLQPAHTAVEDDDGFGAGIL